MSEPATIKFPAGNSITYGQDLAFHRGIPANIPFRIDKVWPQKGVWLRAPGYGGKPYGNGRIYVPFELNT